MHILIQHFLIDLAQFYYQIILIFQSFNGVFMLVKNNNLTRNNIDIFSKKIFNYSINNFNEISFIDFTNQRTHLYLDHGRNGFPHPAHIGHLEKDWYLNNKIFVPESFKSKFPLSMNQLFSMILNSDIKLIIVYNKTLLYDLLDESIFFKKNKILTNSMKANFSENGVVFERQ